MRHRRYTGATAEQCWATRGETRRERAEPCCKSGSSRVAAPSGSLEATQSPLSEDLVSSGTLVAVREIGFTAQEISIRASRGPPARGESLSGRLPATLMFERPL